MIYLSIKVVDAHKKVLAKVRQGQATGELYAYEAVCAVYFLVPALLYAGCVLLGRVLQAAGRLSLDVRCVRLVSSSCSCLDQHLVFVAALGDETFSTRGGNIRSCAAARAHSC